MGAIAVEPDLAPPADAPPPEFRNGSGPRVAICMATYEPPGDLLRTQLDSLREQTHRNWVCLISDDASSEAAHERLLELTAGDDALRGLAQRASASASTGTSNGRCRWPRRTRASSASATRTTAGIPSKLERLLSSIGDAQLVYSDARIVTPGGELVRPSYWTERRNNYTSFGSLLIANSVTGAASMFRREVLDDALPFPPRLARAFHDHWVAVIAMALGELAYVDEPLYDYVQHGEAVIGHSKANKRPRPIRRHLIERLRNPTGGSRAVYYYDWQQQLLLAEVLRLRCWERMSESKRRTLSRLLSADSGIAGLAWMLGRRGRRLWGRNETLDRELFYGYALVRRRAVSAWTAGRNRPNRLLPRDISIPPDPDRVA